MLTKKKNFKLMSLAFTCFLFLGMFISIYSIPVLALTGDTSSTSNVVSIINSTFEDDDSTVWTVNGGGAATLTRTTTEAQAGIKSLAVTKRTLAYQGPRVNVLGKIAAGTTYTTSVWVKFSGTGTKEFKVTLNSTTDSYKNMIDTFVPANTWTKITGTYTTSTSTTPITSAVVYLQCMDATLDYYVDNFSITTNAPSTGGSGSTGTVDSGSSGSGTSGSSGSGTTGTSNSGTSGTIGTGTSTTSSAVIINSTFEADDTTVWGKNGSPIITRTTTEAQAGISSLVVTGRTATYMGPQADLTGKIQGGKTYQTSFWVKFNGTGTKTFNVILYGTIDGATVYKTMATKSVSANTWTQVTGTYTCPSGTITMAKPYLECSDATADYYIDNFNIINGEISSGSNGTSGSGSTGTSGSGTSGSGSTGTSNSGSSGTIGTGTSTTSSAVIINSTFEGDDTTVWGKNGSPTITRTTTEAQAGISSLAVTGRTATYMGPQVDLTGKIQGGKTYQTSFWVKFNGTGTKTFNVILYGTIDGAKVYKTMATKSVPANIWTQVTGTYTCPSGTVTMAKPYVECSDATGDFYIDNFSITNGTSSSGSGGTSNSGSSGSGTGSTGSSGAGGSGTGGSSGSGSGGSGAGGSGGSSTGKTVKLIGSEPTDSSNNVTNNTDKSENTQVVQKGWKLNGYNKWTFINNESRATGWNLINSKWYVFDIYGQMKTGWFKETTNGKWYFLNNNGEMKTGWMQDTDGKWYFLNNSGDMKTGWMQDTNGKWYFLNISGEMMYNASVDGYTLGSDGAWIQ